MENRQGWLHGTKGTFINDVTQRGGYSFCETSTQGLGHRSMTVTRVAASEEEG